MNVNAVTAADGAALYAERMKRVMDAVELRRPARAPTVFFNTFWIARYGGISYRQAMYDYDRVCQLVRQAVIELQPDLFALPHQITLLGPVMARLGFWAPATP